MKKFAFILTLTLIVLQLTSCSVSTLNNPTKQSSTSKQHTHSLITIPGKDPTCTETGLSDGKKCSTCYEIVDKQETIPALDHNWSSNTCTRCGITKDLELDPTDNSILTIQGIDWDINSASGVEPNITFTNKTNKQIAYIWFTVKFYDRMGSPAYCSIKRTHTQRLKVTGPVEGKEQDTRYWEPVIYNNAVAVIKPLSIRIEYTDGTVQNIICTDIYWCNNSYYGGELKD